MSWDIYGNPLARGHCEVHPHIHEEFPCSLCIAERNQHEQRRQQQEDQVSIDQLRNQRGKMLELLKGFVSYANCSTGIAGYHLNGDLLDWSQVDEVDQAIELITEIEGGEQ